MNSIAPSQFSIVFADIAGSTQLYETVGDTEAQACIGACLEALSDTVRRHNGVVVKTIGDELMSRFDNAEDAINAACDMQSQMDIQAKTTKTRLSLRVGLHHGPALLKDNDLFGDAVNVAARMAAIAKANQIITTDDTISSLPAWLAERARKFDHAMVKGKKDPITIFEIVWKSDNLTEVQFTNQLSNAAVSSRLRLVFQGEPLEMAPTSPTLTLGRDTSNTISVQSSLASRIHSVISYQRGKFVLTDQSTNGTYICMPDIDNMFIRREDFPLVGEGTISCGEKVTEGNLNLIRFYVD